MTKAKELINQLIEGRRATRVLVPKFRTSKQANDFVRNLRVDFTPDRDVIDPETGEVLMQPGDTKRQDYKSLAKQHKVFAKDIPVMFGMDSDFERFYNVVWKSLEDEVDDPEEFYAGDYDVSYSYPKYIKRKDRQALEDDDLDNIEEYMTAYNKEVLPHNLELEWHKASTSMVQGEVNFA